MEDYGRIPELTMESLRAYVDHGRGTGHFLTAVLSNDLFGAFSRADGANVAALPDLVTYVYNCVPGACWGSREKVTAWQEAGGMGQYARKDEEVRS